MYQDITVEEFKNRFKDGGEAHLLLDVRTIEEYEDARIAGSTLIPMNEIPSRLSEIEDAANEQPVIVMCRTGMRSAQVAQFLTMRAGFKMPVYNLDDGIMAWARQRWPIERGPE